MNSQFQSQQQESENVEDSFNGVNVTFGGGSNHEVFPTIQIDPNEISNSSITISESDESSMLIETQDTQFLQNYSSVFGVTLTDAKKLFEVCQEDKELMLQAGCIEYFRGHMFLCLNNN